MMISTMRKTGTILCVALLLTFYQGNAQTSGGYESQTLLELVDRAFNVDSDAVDPESGTLTWKGRNFQIGEGRVMNARFMRYLNTPVDTMDTRLYLSLLEQIRERLSTLARSGISEDDEDPWGPVIAAWRLLFQAAEFEIDGGNSLVVANLVYDNWRDRELFRNEQFREDIEAAERGRLEERVVIETQREEIRRTAHARELARMQEDNVELPTLEGQGMTILQQAMKQLAEQEAELAARGLKQAEIGLKARLKMQSQILGFLSQRRFHHALLLSSFYRTLFQSTAQDLQLDTDTIVSFIPELELIPTVDSLEFMALQAMDDVRVGMSSVQNAYNQGQLISALERLQETFFLGEYTLPVIRFPEEKKRVLRNLYQDLREARKLAELKDFDELEILVNRIAEIADDFPSREALSTIRVAKRASQLKLLSARGAIGRGDAQEAEKLLTEAFEIWPLNPDIESFMSDSVTGASLAQEFDRDFQDGDYRRIFNRREEYMAATVGDPLRGEQLKEALETVQTIDFAIRAAEQRLNAGEPYVAWEILKEVETIGEEDRLYQRMLSRIVPRIPRFVSAINDAERELARGNLAAALAKYAEAADEFPGSQVARSQMENLSARLLQKVSQQQ